MIFNKSITALVPMKEHSERVPGKNIRLFTGRPLFYHILDTLEKTYAIDEIVVDTDSGKIATEARANFSKVRVIERPKELQGGFISMNAIIDHDISQVTADVYLQTHATNPLLRSETITEGLRNFIQSEKSDSLFSVNRLQTRLYTLDGKPINHDPEELLRTQDLSPVLEENSALYIFTRESFAKNTRRIGANPLMFVTDPIESIDIDDEYTFHLAELLTGYARNL